MLGLAAPAQAAPGDLDGSFDFDGRVTTHLGASDVAGAVAVQADGKIVVAAGSYRGEIYDQDFELVRYNPDGTLDSSFSGDGRQTTDFAGDDDYAGEVAIQADGRIVVTGTSHHGATNLDFAVARYGADGTLDRSFSGDGKQTTDFAETQDLGGAVAIQGDGKIVQAGKSQEPGTARHDFALVRYNADGTLDRSFSGDGRQTTDFAEDDSVDTVALQPNGKIVVGGVTLQGADFAGDFALARYNPDGTLDRSFSGDGRQTADVAGSDDFGGAAVVQADGKIVVAGHSDQGSATGFDFALVRYNPDGTLDRSFSGDGKQTTDFAGRGDFGRAAAIQVNGKIVVAGYYQPGSEPPQPPDLALARYSANGELDSSFSADGKQTTDFAEGHDYPYAVAIQADGKIVVAGSSYQGFSTGNDIVLARYLGDDGANPPPSDPNPPSSDPKPPKPPGYPTPDTGPASGGCPVGASAGVSCQALPGGGWRITGTAGNDRIVGTNASDIIRCGDGDDVVQAGPGNDTINCGDGRDRIAGNAGHDRIFGEAGNDGISGDSGNDSISGGTGNDRGAGGSGRDRINGNSGDDILSGDSGNDSISGSSGRDRISGNSGNDRLSGNAGNDRLNGGSGRDRLSGASGNDAISARDRTRDSVSCSRGRDRVSADRIDRVSRTCERVRRRG